MSIKIELRQNIIKLLSKYIKENDDYNNKIEQSIYDFTIDYIESNNASYISEQIYENKANEIIKLLENELTYVHILKLIQNKIVAPENLAFLKDQELYPQKYDLILKTKEIQNTKSNKKGSTVFECSKCKQRNSDISQKQMRAGDEPPTTIITCLNCGNTIKF
jgi:DNA-directed RNA polymerase subunit M/transcription elongation factor TFIIS